jgi:hypothetical protein
MSLPAEPVLRSLIQQTASLQHRLGKEIGKRSQVLPNGKYFPDKFAGDKESVLKLLRRMQEHAGITDIPIEIRVLGGPADSSHGCGCSSPSVTLTDQPKKKKHDCKGDCGGKGCKDCDGSCHQTENSEPPARAEVAKSCGSGCGSSCALPTDTVGDEPRLVDLGHGWRIQVPQGELSHPVALTTNLARALGIVFLLETSTEGNQPKGPIEPIAEIVSCLLGFGSLLLAGSYVYSKSCGGPRVSKITTLGPYELAVVTALFTKGQNHELRPLLRELDVTQKDAVEKAADWLDERPAIIQLFASAPAKLADGEIPMTVASKGLFSRWFGKSKSAKTDLPGIEGDISELEAMVAKGETLSVKRAVRKPDPKHDELRALVDEALNGVQARPE